jgi:chemotaxis protein MotB
MGMVGKRKRFGRAPAAHGEELWVVSYADMMTLLFGFFVILYSLSQVDDKKFNAVGREIADAFGEKKKVEDTEVGQINEQREIRALQYLIAMLNLGDNMEEAVDKIERTMAESKDFDAAKQVMKEIVEADKTGTLAGIGGKLPDKSEVTEIVFPDSMLFTLGRAELNESAKVTLGEIARLLSKVEGLAKVEIVGHTDSLRPSGKSPYSSNWALSAARAGAVADELSRAGVPPKTLLTRGMADVQPLFPERGEGGRLIRENMGRNRRVHIILKREISDSH